MASVVTHCIPAGSPWDANQVPCPPTNPKTTLLSDVPSGLRRGRFIYFPSTSVPASQIASTSVPSQGLNAWTTNMNNDGWQVVGVDNQAFELPALTSWSNDVINDAAHGTRAYQTTLHYWDHIVAYCNKTFPGGAMPTGVAGFSWGAWCALIVALNRTNCIGYISRSAPVQWNATPETGIFPSFVGQNTSGINLTPLPVLTATGCSVTSGVLTVTVASTAGSGIVANAFVAVNGSVSQTVNAPFQVTNVTGGTTITMPTGAANGNYLQSDTTIEANNLLNTLTTPPGTVLWGNTNELVQWADLSTMCSTAAAVPNTAVTGTLMAGEGHQWTAATTATICGVSTGWVQTVMDPLYPKAF